MADERAKRMRELIGPLRVKPGAKVDLAKDFDPGYTPNGITEEQADSLLQEGVELLAEYQEKLAAQDSWSVLMCLQALDAAGKDGTISHVMSGVNPQGVEVHSFKAPSAEELDHDFLWRCQLKLPTRGNIGIFNRSHYEEVLVVRVHPAFLGGEKLPDSATGPGIWDRRYRAINEWERHLAENGYKIVKIFLHMSKEEQRKRFLARIDESEKNWKFSAADVKELAFWDDFQDAYAEMLSITSTEWAPWYVVPADHKWFARVAAAAVLGNALVEIDPQWPVAPPEEVAALAQAKAALEAEAPPDAAPDPNEPGTAVAEPAAAPTPGSTAAATVAGGAPVAEAEQKRGKKHGKKHGKKT